jgi:regulatory protein
VKAQQSSGRTLPSLKGRALRYLSRREHSRLELRRKLGPHAESAEQLERVLDQLESARLLSNERFAESLVHRRARGHGNALIAHELRAHAIDPTLIEAQTVELRASELERARALWERRFGARPDTTQAFGRQMRFLLSRGFSGEVVRRVIRDGGGVLEDETFDSQG